MFTCVSGCSSAGTELAAFREPKMAEFTKINGPDPGSSANIQHTMELLLFRNGSRKKLCIKGKVHQMML
jgi:hypothetical protein